MHNISVGNFDAARKLTERALMIDPLSYFRDTGRSDPEGRAEKLFMFGKGS